MMLYQGKACQISSNKYALVYIRWYLWPFHPIRENIFKTKDYYTSTIFFNNKDRSYIIIFYPR